MSLEKEVKRQLMCRRDGVVDLNQRNLGDVEITELSAFLNDLPIKQLYLWRNNIADDGCKVLASALAHNTTITELVLIGNHVTPIGCAALADYLRSNTTLTSINLNGNNVGAKESDALIAAKWMVPPGWRHHYQRHITPDVIFEAEQRMLNNELMHNQAVKQEANFEREQHLRELAGLKAEILKHDAAHRDTVHEILQQHKIESSRYVDEIAELKNQKFLMPQRFEALVQDVKFFQTQLVEQQQFYEGVLQRNALEQQKHLQSVVTEIERVQLRTASEKASLEQENALLHLRVGELSHQLESVQNSVNTTIANMQAQLAGEREHHAHQISRLIHTVNELGRQVHTLTTSKPIPVPLERRPSVLLDPVVKQPPSRKPSAVNLGVEHHQTGEFDGGNQGQGSRRPSVAQQERVFDSPPPATTE